jgi:hypothetical protein
MRILALSTEDVPKSTVEDKVERILQRLGSRSIEKEVGQALRREEGKLQVNCKG